MILWHDNLYDIYIIYIKLIIILKISLVLKFFKKMYYSGSMVHFQGLWCIIFFPTCQATGPQQPIQTT